MKIQCSWCKKDMGEKAPLEDLRTSHGQCPECQAEMMEEIKRLNPKLSKDFECTLGEITRVLSNYDATAILTDLRRGFDMTREERREAARESLQELISGMAGNVVRLIEHSDENEVLMYEEKDIAELIIEVLRQDYHIGGDNGRRKE